MSTATDASTIHRELELFGQTVVIIGGSAGMGSKPPGMPAQRVPR
jgi:hypothetical protein